MREGHSPAASVRSDAAAGLAESHAAWPAVGLLTAAPPRWHAAGAVLVSMLEPSLGEKCINLLKASPEDYKEVQRVRTEAVGGTLLCLLAVAATTRAGPIARNEQGLLPALLVTSIGLHARRQWTRVLVVAVSAVFLAMRMWLPSTC